MNFLTLKPETFGLDISDSSLKIIKLKKKRGTLSLASFGEREIKPGVVDKGEIKNEEILAKTIKEALPKVKGEKLTTKYVIASLPEEKTFLQVIQLPRIPEEDLKSAVIYEAENYIPLPIEEVYLDYQIVKPAFDHLDHFDILIAALPRKTVDPYLSSLRKAGLTAKVLEIESLAIARALIKNEVTPSPTLLIDLEVSRASFIIFSGYSLRFTSSIPISSPQLTKIPALNDLIEEIKKYLSFYQTHASHEHLISEARGVEKIFLSGGGVNLKELMELLPSELKIPVELGNPWINILPEPLKEVPELPFEESLRYTTALGLALRGLTEE